MIREGLPLQRLLPAGTNESDEFAGVFSGKLKLSEKAGVKGGREHMDSWFSIDSPGRDVNYVTADAGQERVIVVH